MRNLQAVALSGRSSPRALAAAFKVCGRRLERRWPYLPRAKGRELNLDFADLLEFQRARSSDLTALVIGAFDGIANDPGSDFIRNHAAHAVFVEPQPAPFRRLCESMRSNPRIETLNAAMDEVSGSRKMYCIPGGIDGLPAWTEQLASFDRDHLVKHEERVPGLARHIQVLDVPTLSFNDLLAKTGFSKIDLLQIDAEGMDAKLLAWFPLERVKPAIIHYEVAHMSAQEHASVTERLQGAGYSVFRSESPTDDMAIVF